MSKFILTLGLVFSAVLLSSCRATNPVTYSPDYAGYTVGYGYNSSFYNGNGGGYGVYDGYGGWASSYYVPGPH